MQLLWVEDDPVLVAAVRPVLRVHHEVDAVSTLAEARKRLAGSTYDAVLLDQALPDGEGVDLIPEIKRRSPTTGVLVVTGDDNYRTVVAAIQRGADEYLVKSDTFAAELLVRVSLTCLRAARPGGALPVSRDALGEQGLADFLKRAEKAYLARAVDLCDGNVTEAARRLGLGRSTLFAKASDLGLRRTRDLDAEVAGWEP
ncbi:MAG TPA: response regulator [Bdellovibrionota bacterium]|nr:response regulator [Bdellovibrionota bacterium]